MSARPSREPGRLNLKSDPLPFEPAPAFVRPPTPRNGNARSLPWAKRDTIPIFSEKCLEKILTGDGRSAPYWTIGIGFSIGLLLFQLIRAVMRTSNLIESVFATVRYRIVRMKGALPQDTARLMAAFVQRDADATIDFADPYRPRQRRWLRINLSCARPEIPGQSSVDWSCRNYRLAHCGIFQHDRGFGRGHDPCGYAQPAPQNPS